MEINQTKFALTLFCCLLLHSIRYWTISAIRWLVRWGWCRLVHTVVTHMCIAWERESASLLSMWNPLPADLSLSAFPPVNVHLWARQQSLSLSPCMQLRIGINAPGPVRPTVRPTEWETGREKKNKRVEEEGLPFSFIVIILHPHFPCAAVASNKSMDDASQPASQPVGRRRRRSNSRTDDLCCWLLTHGP